MPLIAFEEALDRVLSGAGPLGFERIPLEAAVGRVLAHDLVAARALPAADQSAMDGYALALEALAGAGPWSLPVVAESRAGGVASPLDPGSACRIFTGAALPVGADLVVMQEAVRREGERVVIPAEAHPKRWQNVRVRGEDLAEGCLALPRGTSLSPAQVGLAAALDLAEVDVARSPQVVVLPTGDELRPAGSADRPGSLPESNALVIAAITRRVGGTCRVLPAVGDDRPRLEDALRSALASGDVVVTVGGASVGDHDLVRPTLESLGAEFSFSGVSMRPGKPTAFGRHGTTRVLCLPGNPASAQLAFHLFGVPLLRALQGHSHPRPTLVALPVVGGHRRRLPACDGRDDFLRGTVETEDGTLAVRLAPSQSSGAPTSFAHADALVLLGGREDEVRDGGRYPCLLLGDLGG